MNKMNRNLTQIIEQYLLEQLERAGSGSLDLQRLDVAQQLGCAPSQVTYVLGTRFTDEKGFLVQSRRGNGGFIRIIRLNSYGGDGSNKNQKLKELAGQPEDVMEHLNFEEIQDLTLSLWRTGLASRREAELLHRMTGMLHQWAPPKERSRAARELLQILLNHRQ